MLGRCQVRWLIGLAFVILTLGTPGVTAQTPIPPEGHFAEVNGIKMYYETYGEGPPLVLLHGFTGTSQDWKPCQTDFSKHYHLIVPDLRGHGRSTNPARQFTHRQSALDIYALLDQLGIKQFMGVGMSSGGMTLLHMATQQPSRVTAMVLVSATSYFPDQARAIMRKSTVEGLTPEDYQQLGKHHVYGDQQIRDMRNEFHNMKDSYDDMNFTPPYLSTISARTLIVYGDRDPFFPVSIAVEEYQAIPHSYLWIIPNGGHVPLGNHPVQFIETVLQFLAGDWEKKK